MQEKEQNSSSENSKSSQDLSDCIDKDESCKSKVKQASQSSNDYPLPESTSILNHQIAGHFHGKGKTKLGMLKHTDGTVLKPMVKGDPRGTRELEFYETVFHNSEISEICPLRSFLPDFAGTWETTMNGSRIRYLCLEDVTENFKMPCILDIKIGSCTYGPDASPEKIRQETAKYPTGTITGFRILGMRIFCHSTQKTLYFDKHYGKQQTPETIADALFLYLNNSCESTVHAILSGLLHKLHIILKFFKTQRHFAFYASSLLFLYEGKQTTWQHWNDKIGKIEKLTFSTNGDTNFHDIKMTSELQPNFAQHNLNIVNNDSSQYNKDFINDVSCTVCNLSVNMCHNIQRLNDAVLNREFSPLFDVRMIDFAHVFPSDKIDENYLFGLERLIGYMKVLQDRILKNMT